ncbi:MAG: polymer-forming cytoskeletal protein [Puniceicoccaceae bacterium]
MDARSFVDESNTSSVFQDNVRIKGDIELSQPLFLDGSLIGNVRSTSHVILGENGVVEGSIEAQKVTIWGRVKGNVTCTASCTLQTDSRIEGDITAATLSMKEGASFKGHANIDAKPKSNGARPPIPPVSNVPNESESEPEKSEDLLDSMSTN